MMMVSCVSPAPYAAGCSGNVPSEPSAQEHIEQVLGGMEILIELGSRLNGTILDIADFQSVRIIICLHAWLMTL